MLESRQSSDHGLKLCCCCAAQRSLRASELREETLSKKGRRDSTVPLCQSQPFSKGLGIALAWNALKPQVICDPLMR